MTTDQLEGLRVAYIGNFRPQHSTENHVATAFESHGATVTRLQENDAATWRVNMVEPSLDVDLMVWTKTWSLPQFDQFRLIEYLARVGIPFVGFHLDRWWGLDRETQIDTEPFFQVPLLVTADGGHNDQWTEAGINHAWLPPAVSAAECSRVPNGHPHPDPPVAFVGSWKQYHPEWKHRMDLVNWLRTTFGRYSLYPREGRQALRGQDLTDLYGGDTIFVGDSCLAGGAHHYWSDRIPETLGRGGFLIHPWVDGLDEHFGPEHLATWELGDFDQLGDVIEHYLDHVDERRAIAAAGREHVLEHHTYERRVLQLAKLAGVAR